MKRLLISSALSLFVMLIVIAGNSVADTAYRVTKTLSDKNFRQGTHALAFSPDGTVLVSGDEGATVNVWDVKTGKMTNVLKGHGSLYFPENGKSISKVNSVSFSPDGKVLASAGSDSVIILWNTATWEKLKSITNSSSPINSIAFSPDGKTLAGGGGVVTLWDAATGKKLKTAVRFSPDGSKLASGFQNGCLAFWDTRTGSWKTFLYHGGESVNALAFSKNGKLFASGDRSGKILLWGAIEVPTRPTVKFQE